MTAWRVGVDQLAGFVESVVSMFGDGTPSFEDRLNRTAIGGVLPASDLDVELLVAIASAGHHVTVQPSVGTWSATLALDGRTAWRIEGERFEEIFNDLSTIERAEQAVVDFDGAALLALLDSAPAQLDIAIGVDPIQIGTHWIRTTAALDTALVGAQTWLSTLNQLGEGPRRLVIADAASAHLECIGFIVHGPAHLGEPPNDGLSRASDYAQVRFQDQTSAADPGVLWPTVSVGLSETFARLRDAAGALAWIWLAHRHDVSDRVVLTFDGARVIQIEIDRPPRTDDDVLQIWQWATIDLDPARSEAVQQAASLALRDTADLGRQARPVLRTARAFFDLSRRQAVAEVLAARRSARDAALSSARAGAETGRAAAAKALDRVVLQLAAAAGLFVAQKGAVLDPDLARLLLWIVFGIVIATGVFAVLIDFPAARASIGALSPDLEHYSDVLTTDDQEALKSLPSLKSARDAVRAASWTAIAVVAVAAVATLAILTQVDRSHTDAPSDRTSGQSSTGKR